MKEEHTYGSKNSYEENGRQKGSEMCIRDRDTAMPICGSVDLPSTQEWDVVNPAQFEGECLCIGEGVYLISGTLTFMIRGACARCTQPVQERLVVPFEERFARDASTEEEIYPFTGNEIDLQESLEEAAFMALPLRLLCKEDCKGLCPQCGADLNEGDCGCVQETSNPFSILKKLDLPEEV